MIKLESIRTAHMSELKDWAESLNEVILPSNITPKTLHDYPECIKQADKMKRLCQNNAKELKTRLTELEDACLHDIESEKYIHKTHSRTGMNEYRATYPSDLTRNRELRRRLANNSTFQQLKQDHFDWDQMAKDWISHITKLQNEMEILQADYLHSGTSTIAVSAEFK
jgi:hypothetical protein